MLKTKTYFKHADLVAFAILQQLPPIKTDVVPMGNPRVLIYCMKTVILRNVYKKQK